VSESRRINCSKGYKVDNFFCPSIIKLESKYIPQDDFAPLIKSIPKPQLQRWSSGCPGRLSLVHSPFISTEYPPKVSSRHPLVLFFAYVPPICPQTSILTLPQIESTYIIPSSPAISMPKTSPGFWMGMQPVDNAAVIQNVVENRVYDGE
jgi:hypothetical protein